MIPFFLFIFVSVAKADEGRFDPPLGGVFLGMAGKFQSGRIVVKGVEPFSAAHGAGISPGDVITRLGDASHFSEFDHFIRMVQDLRRGVPVEVEITRGGHQLLLSLVPDPAILRDHYMLVSYLRRSRLLREREGFDRVLSEIESSVPLALRRASRTSQAYEIFNTALGRLGVSHAAVIPSWTYKHLFAGERDGKGGYTTGLLLDRPARTAGSLHFIAEIYDGSPAEQAGLRRGDVVVRVNGLPLAESPRLSLAGYEANRPCYTLKIERGETIRLEIRKSEGGQSRQVEVTASSPVSGLSASKASIRRFELEGRLIAYIHLWNFLSSRLPDLLDRVLEVGGNFAEGVVVDLRGRGGQLQVTNRIAETLQNCRRPLALLIDRDTRSAKEILAYKMKGIPHAALIGERTAGAVLPANLLPLGGGTMVMLPADRPKMRGWLAKAFRDRDEKLIWGELEGKGIEPDIWVDRPGLYSAGFDPILDRGIREVLERLQSIPRRRRL